VISINFSYNKYLDESDKAAMNSELPCNLLFKYLSLKRTSFLDDCLFRVTQPSELNDPFEMKPRVLVNKYAEEDRSVARDIARQYGEPAEHLCDDRFIEGFYLQPVLTLRLGDIIPIPNIPELREEPFDSMQEVDECVAHKTCKLLEKLLNERYGIFSMSQDATDLLMWSHYAAEHRGIVVGFQADHRFFAEGGMLREVDYRENRVSVSTVDGIIRVAGHKLCDDRDPPVATMLRKHPAWNYEKEVRLITLLENADKEVKPAESSETIYLRRFPESAIRIIILGARVNTEQSENIVNQIRSKPQWHHVRLFQACLSETDFALSFKEIPTT
jgi:Protein of unknown function (DUF2971)